MVPLPNLSVGVMFEYAFYLRLLNTIIIIIALLQSEDPSSFSFSWGPADLHTSRNQLVLQPILHRVRSCTFILYSPLAVISRSTISFYLFFGLRFLVSSKLKCSAFTGPLFFVYFSTCFSHCSLPFSRKLIDTLHRRRFTILIIAYFVL